MKFHIVGTRKELLRVCEDLFGNLDWAVTQSSGIQPNKKKSDYYKLDLEIESRYPKKGFKPINDNLRFVDPSYTGYSAVFYRLPISQYEMYRRSYNDLKKIVMSENISTIDEVRKMIKHIDCGLKSNIKETEYYETHELETVDWRD